MKVIPIDSVIRASQAAGSHFFSRDAMKAFGCKLVDLAYQTGDDVFFVTSERNRYMLNPRKRVYTVRHLNLNNAMCITNMIGNANSIEKREVSRSYALTLARGLAAFL